MVDVNMATCRRLRVLELYSGIGGMHYALQESGVLYEVVQAVDINPTACQVYRHNFPSTTLTEGLIEGALTVEKLEKLCVDMLVMSPPCQPFTRMGRQRDLEDTRTNSFTYLLSLLPRLSYPPPYMLVENVKGFETSQARDTLLETLGRCNYIYQEFLLTPLQFGIPNSRLRYYLIAKRKPAKFAFQNQPEIITDIPDCCQQFLVHKDKNLQTCVNGVRPSTVEQSCQNSDLPTISDNINGVSNDMVFEIKGSNSFSDQTKGHNCCRLSTLDSAELAVEANSLTLRQRYDEEHQPFPDCQKVQNYMEENCKDYFQQFLLSDKELRRFIIMDIVPPSARKTSCFARRYGYFIEGGGSVLIMTDNPQAVKQASELKISLEKRKDNPKGEWPEDTMAILKDLQLRWFTPREMANLLCFPSDFSFPADVTRKQKYKCLGNSLNVHVVSVLLRLLLMEEMLT